MENLSDYLRLKDYDAIKAEKECIIALKKVINICIKHNYIFNVHSAEGHSSISLTTDRWQTSFTAYFKGALINYSSGQKMTIFELLNKLK